jgi:hypothetical protein
MDRRPRYVSNRDMEIRQLVLEAKYTKKQIAEMYGISHDYVLVITSNTRATKHSPSWEEYRRCIKCKRKINKNTKSNNSWLYCIKCGRKKKSKTDLVTFKKKYANDPEFRSKYLAYQRQYWRDNKNGNRGTKQ